MANIQYPQMRSPLAGLTSGLVQGLKLGAMLKQNEDDSYVIKDPGEFQFVTPGDAFKAMESDINTYEEFNKKTSKNTDAEKSQVYKDLLQSGAIKDDLVKVAMTNGIDAKRLKGVYNKIIKNDPTAKAELRALQIDIGPEGEKILNKKFGEIRELNKELVAERINKLKTTYGQIMELRSRGGNKRLNKETIKTVQKLPKIVAELTRLDPAWAEEDIQSRNNRGSGKPDYFYNKETGQYTYDRNVAMEKGQTKPGWQLIRSGNPENSYLRTLIAQRRQAVMMGEDTKFIDDKISEIIENEKKTRPVMNIGQPDNIMHNAYYDEKPASKQKAKPPKFIKGKIYTDAEGRKAKYMGIGTNGKPIWKKVQ